MEDYPATVAEFEARFKTEKACRDYLIKLRWPDGFVCPSCAARKGWTTSRNLKVCRRCQHQVSLTAGTVFQDTRKPLKLWFRGIWCVTSQKYGASAQVLQQTLGLGSYTTAWTWLHKLRRAMIRPNGDQLSGLVEVVFVDVAGDTPRSHRRWTQTRIFVAIAYARKESVAGRIRLARVPDCSVLRVSAGPTWRMQTGSRLVGSK